MTVNLIFQQINEQWIGVGTPPLQSQSLGSNLTLLGVAGVIMIHHVSVNIAIISIPT